MGEKKKSWRTTTAGIAAIVGAIGLAVKAIFDGDPETVVALPELIAAITAGLVGAGFIAAKDAKADE